jgi:tetratricopeptide (TPR) repeat protein
LIPFQQPGVWNHIQARKNEQFLPPPSRVCLELREHPGLEAIIMKCLAYTPTERYVSAVQLLSDLEQYEFGSPFAPPTPTTGNSRREAEMLINEGKFHLQNNDFEKAADCLRRSIQHDPGLAADGLLTPCSADAYFKQARPNEALQIVIAGGCRLKNAAAFSCCLPVFCMGNRSLLISFARKPQRFRD